MLLSTPSLNSRHELLYYGDTVVLSSCFVDVNVACCDGKAGGDLRAESGLESQKRAKIIILRKMPPKVAPQLYICIFTENGEAESVRKPCCP
eukprot:scaffold11395_cov182-Skeletonema_marinoi.AAC.1